LGLTCCRRVRTGRPQPLPGRYGLHAIQSAPLVLEVFRAAVDADRLDLDEWQLLDAAPTDAQVMRALLQGCDPALAAEVYQRKQPDNLEEFTKQVFPPSRDRGLLTQVDAEMQARVGK
jgi:hypothetical protein